MQLPTTTICIYFADTGGGHRSVANAIEAGIQSITEEEFLHQLKVVTIKESIVEKTHRLSRGLTGIYNHLARHHTTWIKYYSWLLQLIRPDSEAYYWLYRSYLHKLLQEQNPSLIVSAHPMLAHCLTRALRELHLDSVVKVAVVVTDPNEQLWRAWGCQNVDLIIVPNQAVYERLLSWNISADKIQVLGMPVHPKFLAPPTVSRAEFLKKLDLSPDMFTVCINASWAGNEHLLNTYRALVRCKRPLQVIFLSGYNPELYKMAVHATSETSIPTAVLPFHNQMPDLMHAVDVMVTKAGGLTTFEALATRLPLVLDRTIEPMPQEIRTLEMLVQAGVANVLNNVDEIVGIVDGMECSLPGKAPLPEQYQLNLTDHAIFDIARSLLYLSNPQIYAEELDQNVA